MKFSSLLFFIGCLTFANISSSQAQEVWTLEDCVRHAIENNLDIRNALINEEMASIGSRQARHNRYPSLNASTNIGNNFGRTIDPSTNQFRTESLTFNSWSLNVSVPIFNGFAIARSIKQAEYQERAAEYDTRQTIDNMQLNVVTYYLNVLFAEDNLDNALRQLEISQRQLERMESLIEAGVSAATEIYDLRVQVALDEERVVMAENAVEQGMLQLKNLLMLEPGYQMELDRPDLEIPETDPLLTTDFQYLYERALDNQAVVKSSEMQIKSAEMGEKIAEGRLLPSINFGGSLSTNYSNRGQEIRGFENVLDEFPAFINGEPSVIAIPSTVPKFGDQAYVDQLDANFGYGLGVTISIPIYNNLNSRLNVQRAKLNTLSAVNSDQAVRQSLKNNISQAQTEARAAALAYRAAEHSLEASESALRNAERKLEAGTATGFDLINSQNLVNNSRNNLLQAKYDYIFKLKVIDFYLGNPIVLD